MTPARIGAYCLDLPGTEPGNTHETDTEPDVVHDDQFPENWRCTTSRVKTWCARLRALLVHHVKAAPYRKQVPCRNGWILLQRRTHGLMLCRCGWKSKRVPLGKDPERYSQRLEAVTKDHERKAAHVPLAV